MARVDDALSVVAGCVGSEGFYASTDTYAHQYWTRDLSFCVETLLALGYANEVRRHLVNLWKRSLPVYFMDHRWSWARTNARRAPELLNPRAWLGIPHALFSTVDSPWHARLATRIFEETTGKRIPGAKRIVIPETLRGGDWRDLAYELHGEYLLSNQCLLHRLRGPGHTEACRKMVWPVNDSLGIDPLGSALSVLWDTCDPRPGILERFHAVLAPQGIRCSTVTRRPVLASCNQYGTIWPFVAYYVILALRKLGENALAEQEFAKLDRLDGFHEWYDPITSAPGGSRGQLWSACLYLRAARAVHGLPSE